MDSQEREYFWKTLCSLPGKDIEAENETLRQTIKLPRLLFRYRPVNLKSLEALRTNKLHFSSANYYDDPFDTFLHIDIEAIKNDLANAFKTSESTSTVIAETKHLLNRVFTEDQLAQITEENVMYARLNGLDENLIILALLLRDEVKKDVWSVCFSQEGLNETLWLKYADQYKGFVQIYDLENDDNFLCGKQDKCSKCGIKNYGTPLYPIYYSDAPYDATNFARLVMLRKLEELAGRTLPAELHNAFGTGFWEYQKVTLIKKECHKYDEEWRMIAGCPMKPPVMIEWVPSGIILGLRMGITERKLVISMAKDAGIKNIFMSYINSQNQLDIFPISTSQ